MEKEKLTPNENLVTTYSSQCHFGSFGSPRNIFGALQQNCVTAISQISEVNEDNPKNIKWLHSAHPAWSKSLEAQRSQIRDITLFKANIFTVAAEAEAKIVSIHLVQNPATSWECKWRVFKSLNLWIPVVFYILKQVPIYFSCPGECCNSR